MKPTQEVHVTLPIAKLLLGVCTAYENDIPRIFTMLQNVVLARALSPTKGYRNYSQKHTPYKTHHDSYLTADEQCLVRESFLQRDACHALPSRQPAQWAPDFIGTIVFGVIMCIIGLVALWQGRHKVKSCKHCISLI